jgi:hypothetical protein
LLGYNNRLSLCPELVRVNFDAGPGPYIPDSEYISASSRSVFGFYEHLGFLYKKSSYIFTAKVWRR